MTQKVDLTDDTFLPVSLVWSKKYAMPIYRVGTEDGVKYYMPDTGEYAGYHSEVNDLAAQRPLDATDLANPSSGGLEKQREVTE